jgi:hypothetical protein
MNLCSPLRFRNKRHLSAIAPGFISPAAVCTTMVLVTKLSDEFCRTCSLSNSRQS